MPVLSSFTADQSALTSESSPIEEAMTKAAHEWALGVSVAERVSAGVPVITAVHLVAEAASETFDFVFAAACRVAADQAK